MKVQKKYYTKNLVLKYNMWEWIFFGLALLVLILFAILYEKWWLPKKCREQKEDKILHVKKWDWVSGNCVANTCSSNYTLDSGTCVPKEKTKERKYIKTSGKRNSKDPFNQDRVPNVSACQDWCDTQSGCYGFDYAGDQQCNLYDVPPIQISPEAGTDCYTLK
jgi:hypothetical protein